MFLAKRFFTVTLAAATALALLPGCQGGGGTATSDAIASQQAANDEVELYNNYIEVNNSIVGDVNDAVIGYFDHVADQEEFSPLEEEYWCYRVTDSTLSYLEDSYTMATAKAEKDDADNALIALYEPMKTLCTTINEIDDYTTAKSYYDDDYAKGKELHATLWAALAQYDPLSDTFLNAMDALTEQQHAQDLQQLQDQGQLTLYAMSVAIDDAQAVQTAIYEQDVYDDNILALDVAALQPLYDAFVTSVENCTSALSDGDQLDKEGLSGVAYVDLFSGSLVEAKVALTDLMQRVKDQKPFDDFDLNGSFAPDASIQNFNEKLSTLIDQYNGIISAG